LPALCLSIRKSFLRPTQNLTITLGNFHERNLPTLQKDYAKITERLQKGYRKVTERLTERLQKAHRKITETFNTERLQKFLKLGLALSFIQKFIQKILPKFCAK